VICGRCHEQQFVAVGLFEALQHVGDVCPRCLTRDLDVATRVVTLAELQQAEREALRQRFIGLREDDLRRLVDDRYQEIFAAAPLLMAPSIPPGV
jgi:hypothetical protein